MKSALDKIQFVNTTTCIFLIAALLISCGGSGGSANKKALIENQTKLKNYHLVCVKDVNDTGQISLTLNCSPLFSESTDQAQIEEWKNKSCKTQYEILYPQNDYWDGCTFVSNGPIIEESIDICEPKLNKFYVYPDCKDN